jgi:hypothetical protein
LFSLRPRTDDGPGDGTSARPDRYSGYGIHAASRVIAHQCEQTATNGSGNCADRSSIPRIALAPQSLAELQTLDGVNCDSLLSGVGDENDQAIVLVSDHGTGDLLIVLERDAYPIGLGDGRVLLAQNTMRSTMMPPVFTEQTVVLGVYTNTQ